MADGSLDSSAVRNGILRLAPSLALLIVFPILYLLIKTLAAIGEENIELATAYGGILSGLGTIGILILTAWYATETRRMASEAEKARKQERKTRKKERERELNSLRRALINEISKIQYFDQLAEKYSVGTSSLSFIAPITVYEANTDKIGRLSEEEVDVVVEFYTRVHQLEDLLRIQKEEDSPTGKDAVTEYFMNSKFLFDEFLRKITFGVVTPTARDRRTEQIRERLEDIDEVQTKAIQQLEKSVEDTPSDLEETTE